MEGTEGEEKHPGEIPENVPQKEQETRDEMLSRHRTARALDSELVLQYGLGFFNTKERDFPAADKEVALKKAAAKGKELASLGYTSSSNNNEEKKGDLDTLVKAIAGVSVSGQPDHSKPNKSVKRREKRAQEEAAREQRIQEEQDNLISDRMIENELLEKKLEPLGLKITEIKPDGHCLYRAVEHQLAFLSGGSSPCTFQGLREMVAAYMRKNASEFLPFFLSENVADGNSDNTLTERFENYCREVESTAAWGGQLELGALTHCLKKHIMIFSGSFPEWRWERSTDLNLRHCLIHVLCCLTISMHLDLASITTLSSPVQSVRFQYIPVKIVLVAPFLSKVLCR
ncbi:hypothetical protein C3L33_07575, partial [Rhododendron williamsianum]